MNTVIEVNEESTEVVNEEATEVVIKEPKISLVTQACRMEGYDPLDKRTPLYTKLGFTKEDAVKIFLDHRYMSRRLVAEKYGMQNIYPKRVQYLNVAQRIYAYVIAHPDRFEDYITEEMIKDIQFQVSSRSLANTDSPAGLGQPKSVRAIIAKPVDDFNQKVQKEAEKLLNVVSLKISDIKSKKDVKSQDLLKLITAFEKINNLARLMSGDATEHVAVIIKEQGLKDMTNAELIAQLNVNRQATVEKK